MVPSADDESSAPGEPTGPGRRRWLLVVAIVATLALAGASVVLLARRSTRTQPSATSTSSSTTTTSGAIAPLTGLPDPHGVTAHRCAVTVKVDNTPAARPQHGIDEADVVYEEVVEGGITRLAAIFQSHAPHSVGPVRSVRLTDQSIVWPIRGVFAFSGGAPYAIASIDTAPVTLLDESRAGSMMYRDTTRAAPHNLYAHVDQMYGRCASPPPPALFTYRRAGVAPTGGAPATSASVGFRSGYAVTWTWSASSRRWVRSIFGASDVTSSGVRVSAANVVIMVVHYVGGAGAFGAEADLTGHGFAWVLTDGRVVKGVWSRAVKQQPARLLDPDGRMIGLSPGNTWVELADTNYSVTAQP